MSRLLLIIRHGEAEGNHEHRFIGQTDVPLSDRGRRQAEAVATHLADAGVERIVASDLQRARNTAAPLADLLGLEIEVEPRLREINNGDWAMHLPTEIEAGWPDLWRRYRDGEDVPRPNGERWGDVGRRSVEALQELAAADTSVTAVFAHGGPVLWAAYWATGTTITVNLFSGPMLPAANGSITTISLPGPRLRSYNETGHIPRDLAPDSDLLPFFGK